MTTVEIIKTVKKTGTYYYARVCGIDMGRIPQKAFNEWKRRYPHCFSAMGAIVKELSHETVYIYTLTNP